VIEIEGLSKSYGSTRAVDHVSFSAPAGRITGSLGPNGAGKTTTLRVLLGLARPDSGVALVEGSRYADLRNPRGTVGAVLDSTGFHPGRTGRNLLRVTARADDGYFRLVGRRSSDLIKTAGFMVGAGEVEAALLEHEAVVKTAVAGVPDREYGEQIVAWVVVRSGSHVTAKTLADYAAARLVSHKHPKEIMLGRKLPRNDMGNVVKRSLFETAPQASFPPRRLQR
jgi:acyl-CoA synthetase (AMP-forming)/AMP-acid ligase II